MGRTVLAEQAALDPGDVGLDLMLGLFVILLIIGYSIVEERSAGGFIDGLPMKAATKALAGRS